MSIDQDFERLLVTDAEIRDLVWSTMEWARKMEAERKNIISAATGRQWPDMERAFGRFRYARKQYDRGWREAAQRGYLQEPHYELWQVAWDTARLELGE